LSFDEGEFDMTETLFQGEELERPRLLFWGESEHEAKIASG
jgi:hypothetical protein